MADVSGRRIGIIGAGRAGTSVAVALCQAGAHVCLVARRSERRDALQTYFAAHRLAIEVTDAIADAIDRPCTIFATADRDLPTAATAGLEALRRPPSEPTTWLHLSGVADPAVLDVGGVPASRGVNIGSCHPLCAILDPLGLPDGASLDLATRPLRGAFFAIAGDSQASAIAHSIAAACGGSPHDLDVAHRSAYHAAATVVANDLVALMHIGEKLVAPSGLPPLVARQALVHLARTAVDAVQDASCSPGKGLADGLTGAVGRGDAATLDRHLHAFGADNEGRAAHRLLSAVLLGLVADRLPESARNALGDVLRSHE